MISWIITGILMLGQDETATETQLMTRFAVLFVFLIIYLLLFVIVLQKLREKRIRKMTALILTVVLIVETAQLIPFLRGRIHVPLEYVCSVDTTYNENHDENRPIWWTSCSVWSTPLSKEELEEYLECSFRDIDFDEEYTYLFVYYYKDVDLSYTNWSKSTPNVIPSTNVFWIGDLSVKGEDTDHTIYVFRFPRKTIVRDSLQWI